MGCTSSVPVAEKTRMRYEGKELTENEHQLVAVLAPKQNKIGAGIVLGNEPTVTDHSDGVDAMTEIDVDDFLVKSFPPEEEQAPVSSSDKEKPTTVESTAATSPSGQNTEIAIVGIGCRFPGGVSNAEELWKFSTEHGDGVVPVPPERWDPGLHHDENNDVKGTMNSNQAGLLEGLQELFDPSFFGIPARDAEQLDPKQRLVMTAMWEALEDAGIPLERIQGTKAGCFIGSFTHDNVVLAAKNPIDMISTTAFSASCTMLSARVSHFLDLRGPCLSLDTACSSSLVAVHLAAMSLINRESSLMIVGGVNAMTCPNISVMMSKGGFLSPDGHCKSFSDLADGYGRSEGCGIVILKRLEDAVRDNNKILGVINATGINQDGRTIGIASPSGAAQQELIRATIEKARIQAKLVRYIEAHGTGTKVGDKIETEALSKAYGKCPGRDDPVYIGSVKANIGHCEGAAGVAGLIRATMSVNKRIIPPHTILRGKLNGNLSIGHEYGVAVAAQGIKVPEDEGYYYAAVNSFGYGGTNSHVILSSPPPKPYPAVALGRAPREKQLLFPVSAKSDEVMKMLCDALAHFSDKMVSEGRGNRIWLERFQRALCDHRTHLSHRSVFRASTFDELRNVLAQKTPMATGKLSSISSRPNVVWVFTGMGPQWWAMGADLFENNSLFRAGVLEADDAYRAASGQSLLPKMFKKTPEESDMHRNDVAQPANFLIQIGLLRVLQERCGPPHSIIGHSVGEVAAAVAAGCLSVKDAALVVHARATMQQRVAGTGGMLAIGLSAIEASDLLGEMGLREKLEIAAFNSTDMVVLAGDTDALEAVKAKVEDSVLAVRMRVEVAYHSHHMEREEIKVGLARLLASSLPSVAPPSVPLFSTVTGSKVEGAIHHYQYWWQNTRSPVLLETATQNAIKNGGELFLEIGPHPVLGGSIQANATTMKPSNASIDTLFMMKRKTDEVLTLDQTCARLFTLGEKVKLQLSSELDHPNDVDWVTDLPLSPWRPQTHSFLTTCQETVNRDYPPGLLLDKQEPEQLPVWSARFDRSRHSWLNDHQVHGQPILPGAGHIEIALEAACFLRNPAARSVRDLKTNVGQGHPLLLREVKIASPLQIGARTSVGEPRPTEMRITVDSGRQNAYNIASRTDGGNWSNCSSGRVASTATKFFSAEHIQTKYTVSDVYARSEKAGPVGTVLSAQDLYNRWTKAGLTFGPAFQGVQGMKICEDGLAIAHLMGASLDPSDKYVVHPAVLDAAFQVSGTVATTDGNGNFSNGAWLPTEANWVSAYQMGQNEALAVVQVTTREETIVEADLQLYSPLDGSLILEILGLRLEKIPNSDGETSIRDDIPSALYLLEWERAALPETSGSDQQFKFDVFDSSNGDTLSTDGEVLLFQATDVSGSDLTEIIQSAVDCARRAKANQQKMAILTVHAVSVPGEEPSHTIEPVATALWGFARVLSAEEPLLETKVIDVNFVPLDSDVGSIVSSAFHSKSNQLAYRRSPDGIDWYTPTLAHHWVGSTTDKQFAVPGNIERNGDILVSPIPLNDSRMEIDILRPGDLASCVCQPVPPTQLGDNEVLVKVHYSSLNFKDSLKAVSKLSPRGQFGTFSGQRLGIDYSGIVVACGKSVTKFRPGDRVAQAISQSPLGSHAIAMEDSVFPVPDDIGLLTICCSLAYGTAYYGLVEVGRIKQGETILVHQATGGVGIAAVQLAKALGATIIATAGTEEKRAFLRDVLGLTHVYDSRTLDWFHASRRLTNRRGLDAIFTAQSGEWIEAGLEALAPEGRYLEIGKIDMLSGRPLSMSHLKGNICFCSIELDFLRAKQGIEFERRMFGKVVELLQDGTFEALPTKLYKPGDIGSAFETMSTAQHIGKLVIDWRDEQQMVPVPCVSALPLLRQDRSYVVTGGLGGFGLEVAEYLVKCGAGQVLLVSRSGKAKTHSEEERVRRLVSDGVAQTYSVDISYLESVRHFIESAQKDPSVRPIAGVFHSATLYEDAAVESVTPQQIRLGLAAKAYGAMNLDTAFRGLDTLDHFCLFSSVSSIIGNQFQSVYAAANAFLEGLAARRQQQGLPGIAVAWGALDAGFVARSDTVRDYLSSRGILPMPMPLALECLKFLLSRPGSTSSYVLAAQFDFGALTSHITTTPYPQWDHLAQEHFSSERDSGNMSPAERLACALVVDKEEGILTIQKHLSESICAALHMEQLDVHSNIQEMGVDSLVSLQISAKVQNATGVKVSAMQLLGNQTVASLADELATVLEERYAQLDTVH